MPLNAFDVIRQELESSQVPVSYRLISRKCRIHVNEAKTELNRYFQELNSTKKSVHATFMVTGEIRTASTSSNGDEMDIDSPHNGTEALELRSVLVDEGRLAEVKASFQSLRSCYIYSLSSEAQTISEINRGNSAVRDLDSAAKFEDLKTFGKVLGSAATGPRKILKRAEENSKTSQTASSSKAAVKDTPSPSIKTETVSLKDKPKGSGKLDWSSARSKAASASKPIASPAPRTKESKVASNSTTKETTKKEEKRPSSFFGSKAKQKEPEPKSVAKDPTPPPPPKQSFVKVKKGAVLSDDEDEDAKDPKPIKSRFRKNASTVEFENSESEREKSLRAMMDIDDSEVIRASTSYVSEGPATTEAEDTQESDVAPLGEPAQSRPADDVMDEDSDPAPKAKPRKRKEKKVIPVGRNGLKKRRVVKTRREKDEKGFRVAVDYSSYESVDEEEEDGNETDTKLAGKGKMKGPVKKSPAAKVKPEPEDAKTSKLDRKPSKQVSDLKRKPSTSGSQKSLTNFFGKK